MSLLPWLRLLRIGTLFSPAADVVAGLAITGLPWSDAALRAVLASVCLYAAGMVWNDFADRHQDAIHRPERPLPRGQIRPAAAAALATALLAAAMLLSPIPGWHGAMALLVLAYDFLLKHAAWAGALTMGTLRGMNLAAAGVLGGVVAEERVQDLLAAAAAYGVYIVAVTVLGILEDAPSVRPRAVRSLLAIPPLAALAALFAVQDGFWPAPAVALLPILLFAARNRRVATWDQPAIRGAMTWLLLGTMVYTALLCLAAARWWEAAGLAAVILPARWIARRIALT